jgi:predicted RNase H-like HicB family nuclease
MSDPRIEVEQETDGRWIAEFVDISGVMAYGASRDEAIQRATALLHQVLGGRPDTSRRARLIKRIFAIQLLAAFGMIAMGVFMAPALPHVVLDAALTPQELQDDEVFQNRLSLLQRTNSFYMTAWIGAGLFLIVTSVAGGQLLRSMCETEERPK